MLPQKKNIYVFSAVTLFIVVEVSHEIYILTYTSINVTAEKKKNIYIYIYFFFCGNIIYNCIG